jgi:hypothetical protein
MSDLAAWIVELLFPAMATATTGVTVLLSIVFVVDWMKDLVLERRS